MSRVDVAVPAAGGTLSMKLAYNIEEDFDYAYVEVAGPAGSGAWTALPTAAIDPDTGHDADEAGIDGASAAYQPLTATSRPYAGRPSACGSATRPTAPRRVRTRRWAGPASWSTTSRSSRAAPRCSPTARRPSPNGWTLTGSRSVAASFTTAYDQFYLASYRAYTSYDKYLQTGPYNFGFPAKPDFVEHFPYQNGLLVNYWDTSYSRQQHERPPRSAGWCCRSMRNPKVIYNLEGAAMARSHPELRRALRRCRSRTRSRST